MYPNWYVEPCLGCGDVSTRTLEHPIYGETRYCCNCTPEDEDKKEPTYPPKNTIPDSKPPF